jgi:hypothetical protein
MAVDDQKWSIVDILLGRHQHKPVMKITVDNQVYHNYRLHEPSRQLEMENGGRYRSKDIFDDPSNDICPNREDARLLTRCL